MTGRMMTGRMMGDQSNDPSPSFYQRTAHGNFHPQAALSSGTLRGQSVFSESLVGVLADGTHRRHGRLMAKTLRFPFIQEGHVFTGGIQHLQPPESRPVPWTAAACCRFPEAALLPPKSPGHRGGPSAGANAAAPRRGITYETLDGQQAGLPKAAAGYRSPGHSRRFENLPASSIEHPASSRSGGESLTTSAESAASRLGGPVRLLGASASRFVTSVSAFVLAVRCLVPAISRHAGVAKRHKINDLRPQAFRAAWPKKEKEGKGRKRFPSRSDLFTFRSSFHCFG